MHDLLTRMAGDLALAQGTNERAADYERRVLWSALGRMMTAALYDRVPEAHGEDAKGVPPEGEISVVHFHRRAAHLIEAYDALFPSLGFVYALAAEVRDNPSLTSFERAEKALCDCMMANGLAYHRGYYLRPPKRTRQTLAGVAFVRGLALHEPVQVSGFGAYQKESVPLAGTDAAMVEDSNEGQQEAERVRAMFQLDAPLDASVLDRLVARGTFHPAPDDAQAEYLRTDGAFRKGYWQSRPAPGLTLARVRSPYDRKLFSYSFCRVPQRGAEEWMEVPPAYAGDYGWLAQIVLHQAGTLPPATVRRDGALVHLSCGYLYPARERRFLSLYSWPAPGARGFRAAAERVLAATFFDGFRALYEALGLSFVESKEASL